MKRKFLFAMLCIVSVLGMRAQEDITSTYLTNADLSTVDAGWTYYSDAYKYQAWNNTNNETVVPAVEFYAGWSSLEHTNFKFSQTITLPAGDYRIAVNAFYREGNDGDGTNNNKAWIFAGETKQNVYALSAADGASMRNYTTGSDMWDAQAMFHDGYFSNAFDFSLSAETEIAVGFEGVFSTMRSWCILGPVKLYKYSLDDYLVDYDTKYAEAEAITGKPMNADVQTALTAAMVDRSSFSLVSEVTAAIQTLTTAVNNATTSVANYASLKAVMDKTNLFDSYGTAAYEAVDGVSDAIAAYNNRTATDCVNEIAALNAAFATGVLATQQPGNGLDMTAYITNPDFNAGNSDGWTKVTPLGGNCAIQGGSRMEYWAGNASNRAEASFDIYQELTNLPAGVYTVSADMYNSLNDEGGDYTVFSPTCGIYGSASNEEVALCSVEGTTLNTYTTGEILVFRGKMTIGAKNTVTPIAARWFLFDNVKLTYARQLTQEEIDANTLPESVTLDPSTTDVTIYGTQTITATVLPANANDKSITWSSSDETVATVSNAGVVTAVGFGTATITATANGADGVSATATVTVVDVTPAAAPAYYSTTIEDGADYYIYNAATGMFLGGGNDWGTHASIIEHGIAFTVTVSDGKYTLDSHTYNNATDHNFNGTYIDNGATNNLYITALSDGKFSISTADGSAYVTAWVGSTFVTNEAANANSSLAQWYFLSKNDRDKMLATASATTPADATYYIKQADISRNLSAGAYNENAWSQYSVGGTQNNSNFAAQVYNAVVDNYQTIENIPNGTYNVTVQAFTSGTDVIFYANDQQVDVKTNDSGAATCSAAAALFAQRLYPNTVTVTVTDRTLKIGFTGDCSGSKWLCYDKFEMEMIGYTPVTGVSATINNDVIEMGTTAQITAATEPATASFNALTYTSSNTEVATVDENGVVTPVAVGTANITVAANEMENVSEVINVTVVAPTVLPESITLNETAVTMDETVSTYVLTATVNPDGASQDVTWTSSDESVATVNGGIITPISSGTTTITVASAVPGYETVTAEAIVTVSFPESTVPASVEVASGSSMSVTTLSSNNLFKNGSFGYPNAVAGWKTIGYTTDAVASNFTISANGGVNDGAYITTNGGGTGSANTIRKSVEVEVGKKYYFSVYTSGKAPTSANLKYNALFAMSDATTESGTIKEFEWPQGAGNTTTEWSKTECIFEATTPYVGVRMGWNQNSSFDEFVLVEVVDESVVGNVQYALDAIPTANIGTAPFQYSQDAIDAANALVQGTASVADVEVAYEAVTTVNAPADGQLFNVVLTYAGWAYDNKAMTFIANGRSDAGLYNIQYKADANQNLAQAFTFTKVSGNNYKMSQIDADGNVRYISTGVPYGGNTGQIRTTTNADNALVVTVIPTATEGVYNLRNTEANNYIGSQDAGVYTVNSHIDFFIVETEKPSITINTTAAGWGTTMLPFAVTSIPEGVKVYSCGSVFGDVLTLEEVSTMEANKPYLIEGVWNEILTGDAQGIELSYTEGLLTGVYAATPAPTDSYVLQKLSDKVGFYQVEEGNNPTVGANRAYLTVPGGAGVKVFFLGADDTDAIRAIEAEEGSDVIYNLAGQRVSKAQKGIFIKNGKKVVVK